MVTSVLIAAFLFTLFWQCHIRAAEAKLPDISTLKDKDDSPRSYSRILPTEEAPQQEVESLDE